MTRCRPSSVYLHTHPWAIAPAAFSPTNTAFVVAAHAAATLMLRSFERGSLEVRGGDWIVAGTGGASMVGVVGEMVQFFALGRSFVRLHLLEVRPLTSFDPMQGACLAVSLDTPSHDQLLEVESTTFHEVHCDPDHAGELRFTYIY